MAAHRFEPSRSGAQAFRPNVSATWSSFEPERVESLRRHLIEREEIGDAVLVSVLAYAGLRPWSEAVAALVWDDVRERMLRVYAPRRAASGR